MKYFCACLKVIERRSDLNVEPISFVQESKSSTSPFDEVLHSAIDDTDSTASEPVGNIYTPNVNEQRNVKQHSLDMTTLDDDWQEAMPSTNDNTRAIHSSRGNSTKVNDPPAQRARTALNESSSLSSVLTNTSSPTNHSLEQIYWIELTIERGKDLAIKDLNGTSDPYVKVFYGTGEKYTTNIVYKSLNPIWNEKCSFLVHDLNVPIQFQLFDYDRIGRDEAMGTTKLDLWKLPIGKSYSATLDLENEKRTDGKVGMMKIDITISPKTSEFREEVGRRARAYRSSLFLFCLSKILRSMAKQFNTKSSVTSRSGGTNSIILARRTIDVFIIEGRNLSATNAWNKLASPFVRLKFGTHKKYRTQVRSPRPTEKCSWIGISAAFQINQQSKMASVIHVRYLRQWTSTARINRHRRHRWLGRLHGQVSQTSTVIIQDDADVLEVLVTWHIWMRNVRIRCPLISTTMLGLLICLWRLPVQHRRKKRTTTEKILPMRFWRLFHRNWPTRIVNDM